MNEQGRSKRVNLHRKHQGPARAAFASACRCWRFCGSACQSAGKIRLPHMANQGPGRWQHLCGPGHDGRHHAPDEKVRLWLPQSMPPVDAANERQHHGGIGRQKACNHGVMDAIGPPKCQRPGHKWQQRDVAQALGDGWWQHRLRFVHDRNFSPSNRIGCSGCRRVTRADPCCLGERLKRESDCRAEAHATTPPAAFASQVCRDVLVVRALAGAGGVGASASSALAHRQ